MNTAIKDAQHALVQFYDHLEKALPELPSETREDRETLLRRIYDLDIRRLLLIAAALGGMVLASDDDLIELEISMLEKHREAQDNANG